MNIKLIFAALILSVLGCNNTPDKSRYNSVSDSNQNSPSNSSITPVELIPQAIADYVKINFTGWEIPDTSDYHKVWWSFYPKEQTPYFVTTDINNDNLPDYALLLKKANAIRLVILVSDGKKFINKIFNNFNGLYSGKEMDLQLGLSVENPRRTDVVMDNSENALVLKSNAITFMVLEMKCRIYYWENGEIKVFALKSNLTELITK